MAIATAAIAGCGGDGAGSETNETLDLAQPLFAKCGTQGFRQPEPARHLGSGEASGWQLSYRVEFVDPKPDPGATTYILLIEESPDLPARGVRGGHPVTIDGRAVSLRTVSEPAPRHFAQWRTEKARYVAIGDGASPARLKRLIACLP